MLSYAPVDRDLERLVEELVVARQFTQTPATPARAVGRRPLWRRFALRGFTRSHLVGA